MDLCLRKTQTRSNSIEYIRALSQAGKSLDDVIRAVPGALGLLAQDPDLSAPLQDEVKDRIEGLLKTEELRYTDSGYAATAAALMIINGNESEYKRIREAYLKETNDNSLYFFEFNLAFSLARHGKFEEAKQAYDRALVSPKPENINTYYTIKILTARKIFDLAVEKESHKSKAFLSRLKNATHDAPQKLKGFARDNRPLLNDYYAVGLIINRYEGEDKAISYLLMNNEWNWAEDMTRFLFQIKLGEDYLLKGNIGEARANLEKARLSLPEENHFDNEYNHALFKLGVAYVQKGDFERAVELESELIGSQERLQQISLHLKIQLANALIGGKYTY